MPRLGLIVAITFDGRLIASMIQSNTNSSVFCMFIRHLVNILDQQDGTWREKTIISIDGAPYHMSSDSMSVYKGLQIPLIFHPPHAYNVAPAELVFAALKSSHLNPEGKSTGRMHFKNVLQMII